MTASLQAVRGMNDILPAQMPYWYKLERALLSIVQSYGFEEIRFPIVEKTALFARSIGDTSDIIEKEMYVFDDRNGESLALRPEGTASCVRAGIEQALLYNQTQKLWYWGPMFRHERPQKGRYRQFHQFGVEVFGYDSHEADLELLLMGQKLWQLLGLQNNIILQINSMGSLHSRQTYRQILIEFYKAHFSELDADSQRRLELNPLRILDSKNPDMIALNAKAPQLKEHLDTESKEHFEALCQKLDALNIAYEINPHLVRGLDYYTKTVFEWVTQDLGAQGTVCAGGRYDGLVEQLGGKSTAAVGFALGMERLVALLEDKEKLEARAPDLIILAACEYATEAIKIAENLRDAFPTRCILYQLGGGSFKNQFKRADKSRARVALILGETEMAQAQVKIKFLRENLVEETWSQEELISKLQKLFGGLNG